MREALGKYLLLAAGIFAISGCANLQEAGKGFLGISTQEIEKSRDSSIKKVFSLGYKICYNRTLEALKKIEAYIYAKDSRKKIIALYVSEADTTPVGIFFKEVDALHTSVEVSSASTFARDYIAGKLFDELDKDTGMTTNEK